RLAVGAVDAQLLKLIHGTDELRIILRIPKARQRNDRVQHGRINRSQAVRLLESLQHPLLSLFERDVPQRPDVNALEPVRDAVDREEEVPPAHRLLLIPAQMQVRVLASADEELADAQLLRNLLERLLRANDRQRNKNAAPPRADLGN